MRVQRSETFWQLLNVIFKELFSIRFWILNSFGGLSRKIKKPIVWKGTRVPKISKDAGCFPEKKGTTLVIKSLQILIKLTKKNVKETEAEKEENVR